MFLPLVLHNFKRFNFELFSGQFFTVAVLIQLTVPFVCTLPTLCPCFKSMFYLTEPC